MIFIYIKNSLILNNSFYSTNFYAREFIAISRNCNVYIADCKFSNNINGITIIKKKGIMKFSRLLTSFLISNTSFLSSSTTKGFEDLIRLSHIDLRLKGPVFFTGISTTSSVILLFSSKITCSNHIKFSNCQSKAVIKFYHETGKHFTIFMEENTTIQVSNNTFSKF